MLVVTRCGCSGTVFTIILQLTSREPTLAAESRSNGRSRAGLGDVHRERHRSGTEEAHPLEGSANCQTVQLRRRTDGCHMAPGA